MVSKLNAQPSARTLFIISFLLFLLAVPLRIRSTVLTPSVSMVSEHVNVAKALAERGEFADPYAPAATGKTAHMPPAWPALMAVIYKFAGVTRGTGIIQLLDQLLICLGAPAVFLFAWSMTREFVPSLLSGILFAIVPFLGAGGSVTSNDTPFTTLLTIFLSAATLLAIGAAGVTKSRLWLIGIGWGLAMLCGTAPVPCLFAFIGVAGVAMLAEKLSKAALGRLVVIFLVAIATTIPWAIRNTIALGAPTWIRSNFGLELYVSNSPCAHATIYDNAIAHCFDYNHPAQNRQEALAVRALGEPEYNRERGLAARRWIKENPSRFLTLTQERVLRFWFPDHKETGRLSSLAVGALTVLSIPGLVLLWRRNWLLTALLLSFLLGSSVVYYIVQSATRYRYPVWWITVMGAAWTLYEAAQVANRKLFPGTTSFVTSNR